MNATRYTASEPRAIDSDRYGGIKYTSTTSNALSIVTSAGRRPPMDATNTTTARKIKSPALDVTAPA